MLRPPRRRRLATATPGLALPATISTLLALVAIAVLSTAMPSLSDAQSAEKTDLASLESQFHPVDPPLTVQPGAVVSDDGFSFGTRGQLRLDNESRFRNGVRSTLQGNVLFESGELERTWEDIQGGDLRFRLNTKRHGIFASAQSDMRIHTLTSGYRFSVTKKFSMDVYQRSTLRNLEYYNRFDTYSRFSVRRRLTRKWTVQPAIYRVTVGGPRPLLWYGFHLRSRFRNTSCQWITEPQRSSRLELEHRFQVKTWTTTVGSQWVRYLPRPTGQLWHLGVSQPAWGIDLYHGPLHAAQLFRIGHVIWGWSRTPVVSQRVLAVKSLSLWMDTAANGDRSLGLGFAFRGSARRFTHDAAGWSSLPTLNERALNTPHVRWPRFASRI